MYQVVSYERQIWLRRAKPAGQRQKWLQKEFLKQPKQPPKLPQTAPTTLLQLKVYLATLGTNGRSQDWNFSQETPLPPQERTRHLTVAGALNRYGLAPNGYGSYLPKKAPTPNNSLLLSAPAI